MRSRNDRVNPDQRARGARGDLDERAPDRVDGADEAAPDAELVRLPCPDCGQPIALYGPGESLPVHALCPTPWNPFGLTVCPGSGRSVSDAAGRVVVAPVAVGDETSRPVRATLPEGLDWRLRPFSHAGSADQVRLPSVRQAA